MGFVSVETNLGGPLGHPVSPASVSRLRGRQKSILSVKFCKNEKVPPMGKLRTQLRVQISLREILESEIFDFSKLAPERSWGNAGMVGHAETCSNKVNTWPRGHAPRAPLSRQGTRMTINF